MSKALEGVKVGDNLVCDRNQSGMFDVYQVERLTKTLAVCGTRSFTLDTGKMRGTNSWSSRWARIPTADDLAAIEDQRRIHRAKLGISRIEITAANVEAAEAFIAASQPKPA